MIAFSGNPNRLAFGEAMTFISCFARENEIPNFYL